MQQLSYFSVKLPYECYLRTTEKLIIVERQDEYKLRDK